MKRLVFGEGFLDPTLDGSKRFTVKKAPFKKLKTTKKKQEKEGYYFDNQYFENLKTFPGYSDITLDTMGAVVFFEVLKIEFAGGEVPVVQFNEHAQQGE